MNQFASPHPPKSLRARKILAGLLDAAALGLAWKLTLHAILFGGVLKLLQTFWLLLFGNAIWLYFRLMPLVYRLARSSLRRMDSMPPAATRKILAKALAPELRRALYPALTAGPTALAFLVFGVPPRRETAAPAMALATAASGAALIAAALAWIIGALRGRSPSSMTDVAIAFLGPFARKPLFVASAFAAAIVPIYLFGKDRGNGPGTPLLMLGALCLTIALASAARAFHRATLAYFEGSQKPEVRIQKSAPYSLRR